MESWRQVKLLLWKDYLIRKRKLVTLGGAVWATIVVLSLVIVRSNIDTQNVPTCQYTARALPSAGMLTFLQSFICSVNNECHPLEEYEEIPLYANSRIRDLERQFGPLLYNDTILEVAGLMPDAMKLVATFSNIIDEPDFHRIGRNGLHVSDLFVSSARVKRYLATHLKMDNTALDDIMAAEIQFQGLFNTTIVKCDPASLSALLLVKNTSSIEELSQRLCEKSDQDLERILMELLPEVNYRKFFRMISNMLSRLNGENWLGSLGGLASAALRLSRVDNLLPSELASLLHADAAPTFNITIITAFMNLFEPTFGDTAAYKSLRGVTDTLVEGTQWLYRIFQGRITKDKDGTTQTLSDAVSLVFKGLKSNGMNLSNGLSENLDKLKSSIQSGFETMKKVADSADISMSTVFRMLSKVTSAVVNILPPKLQHEVLYYSTLLTKLIEGAHQTVLKNMHMEEIMYNVTKRQVEGVNILKALPPSIVGKMFDALSDAERAQIFTSKIMNLGQMFCDVSRLQNFFWVTRSEAEALKKQMCNSAFKNYASDIVNSFGIFEVKSNINKMASLVVTETIGRDNSDSLYTIDKDFLELENFIEDLSTTTVKMPMDWPRVLNISEDSEIFKVVRTKMPMVKKILLVVHGALAREVIKQNPILEAKITPILIHSTSLLTSMNLELEGFPRSMVTSLRELYSDIVKLVLGTLLDKEKTFKTLSTTTSYVLCKGVDNSTQYLVFPDHSDQNALLNTLCQLSKQFDKTLDGESKLAKTIYSIQHDHLNPMKEVNWVTLISQLKKLYTTLETEFGYVFSPSTYGMDNVTVEEVANMSRNVMDFWFDIKHMDSALHISIKVGFHALDILDRKLFNLSAEVPAWGNIKHAVDGANSLLVVTNQMVRLFTALTTKDERFEILQLPITVKATRQVIPNLPQLIKDAANVIIADNTSISQVISLLNSRPAWPCSERSMADILSVSVGGSEAVRGLELLMCNRNELQREWVQYAHAQKIRNFKKIVKENTTTELESHIFLKLSNNFDEFIRDMGAMDLALKGNGNSPDSRWDIVGAVKQAIHVINETGHYSVLLSKVFANLDHVLEEIDTSPVSDASPTVMMWEDYIKCSNSTYIEHDCQAIGRAAWKNTFKYISVAAYSLLDDLFEYFSEVNEPNANLLQVLGFTRGTGLYTIYEKWPDFLGVLLNSYWDYGFMNQIRRASKSLFWDCESVVKALVIPLGSSISEEDVRRVQPYVCPSVLYWISLPKGENSLLNLVAKTQYYFYTMQASNLTSSYKPAYEKVIQFRKLLDDISKVNISQTLFNETIENRLNSALDSFTSWNIAEDDSSYRLFNEINKKQFISTIYLTKISAIVNKFFESISSFNSSELPLEDAHNVTAFVKLFKRRPTAMMEIYFDVITGVIWKNKEDYTIGQALDAMCENVKINDTSNEIMSNNTYVKTQFCAKNYGLIHKIVDFESMIDANNSRKVLISFVQGLQNNTTLEETNMLEFFKSRRDLVKLMKLSMKYSEELGLGIYVKYLQSNLQHYNVVLQFVSGEDWWTGLKDLYSGPYAQQFFSSVDNSFAIAEDMITHLDKIRIVRLLKDMNINNTDMFCLNNLTISDYIPDSTGALSKLKMDLCNMNRSELFKELPPLLYASQGFDKSLKLSRDVDYASVDADIAKVQAMLKTIQNGPKTPMRPSWITDEKVHHLREVTKNILSKESVTKIIFGTLSNVVDAVTLFMNNSDTATSSMLTTWLRQINLQLFKKDEYDALLCHLSEMSLTDTYSALKTNFHWDMAIEELISQRNYTKYELNKALNQFLEHVSSHILHTIRSNSSHLRQCLAADVSNNTLGNMSYHLSILTKTLRMIRSAFSHLEEIEGIKKNNFLMKLSTEIAHRLPVLEPLSRVLVNRSGLGKIFETLGNDTELLKYLEQGTIDISKIQNHTTIPITEWLSYADVDLHNACARVDCNYLTDLIINHINIDVVSSRLPTMQAKEFWQFGWLSDMFLHVENLLTHVGNIALVGSRLDLSELLEGRVTALLDTLLTILQKDNMKNILLNIIGITEELHPLLKGTELEFELQSIVTGLHGLGKFRDSIIEGNDLSVEVWRVISEPQRLEYEIKSLGINHTNFWSVAAPRIHVGRIDFKPLLTTKEKAIHLKSYVCQPSLMSQVIVPSDLDVVTADDVYRAVGEQFCTLSDRQTKQLIPVVLRSFNMTYIINNIMDVVLFEVYQASNLTQEEGKRIISKYGEMVSLMPVIQENLGNISDVMSKEPLIAAFKKADSVKGLLGSSEFLAHAGNMLCGKPLLTDNNRFYKAIAETKDFSTEPDPRQLEALPTDFCRSMYKDILSMAGGKIVWSFVKPLIMGKILFTPDTPVVGQIMSRANGSFAQISRIRDLITNFANSFGSIDVLSKHKESLITFRHLMNSARFRALAQSFTKVDSSSDDAMSDMDFTNIFDELGDVQSMAGMVRRLSDMLGCVNLNRFLPMKDELKLSNEAVKLTLINEFSAGIVFNESADLPNNAEYKIRMDIESVPTTSRKRNQFWTPGPEASFIENMRYFRGFIQIQDLIDKAIIQEAQNMSRHKIIKRDSGTSQQPDWAIYTQQMPYACYKRDVFQSSLYETQALMVAFYFSLILTVSSIVRFIVHERESGNTTLMSVMGLRISNHTTSWFIASFIEMTIASTLMFLVLKLGGVLPHSDPFLLWLIMFNYGFSVVMFCYMVSKLFKSASLGSVCTCILYLTMFLPFVIVIAMEGVLDTAQKIFTCISMCTAFCYSILYLGRYEAIGEGAQWSNVWSSPEQNDKMSIATTTLIVLIDAMLYAFIGWLIEWFTEYRNRTDNLINSQASSEKAGVSIINISKTYGEGTRKQNLALDNVSIELNRGQITTLLGQNGAGKTTLIKIITGMLKPSKGSIVIRTDDTAEDSHVKLGVCPQIDVLIENMTTVEHLQFYALLKSGKRYNDVELEVQSMLQVLGFGGTAYEQVWRLSGGLRRRLCVALAFICRPRLVLLDEPSSGVDPVARTDTWSLIVKLKEDRTVLLTTHHLDEAELLSDQIVIMHKGRVHTTGSPIEIKRSLGNGYKLTAFYSKSPRTTLLETKDKQLIGWEDETSENKTRAVQELSKELLGAVRGVVKNAQLSDVKGKEVEITLPFFDADGLNNDFLGVCKVLESRQTELGLASYTMDCSSLEHVFLNICQQADSLAKAPANGIDYSQDYNTSSSSSSQEYQAAYNDNLKCDNTTLVPDNGGLTGSQFEQYMALLHKRFLHYRRNWWLLALLFALPTLFLFVAMGFSLIRPPADNEIPLRLHPSLYGDTTEFLVPHASHINGGISPAFAEDVMATFTKTSPSVSAWNPKDNPQCKCTEVWQECDYSDYNSTLPHMLTLPDTSTLLNWATDTQQLYIENRYGGWSSSIANNRSNLVAWYNNKGHHAMPSYVNALNTAVLRVATADNNSAITTYTHPLKISEEQLSKSTVLQHVADIGITAVILIGFSLIPAASAIYLVQERQSQQKRLQLLCGVKPLTYWLAAITWDMLIVLMNIGLTVCVLEIFQQPVFVEKDNLAAICLLLLLFGWACNTTVHVFEKLFTDASLANMMLFCLNVFLGISGLAILLILDIISDSDLTDNARWTLHKVFMLSPQFALGDGLIEIAKNTIQAQVLMRFGMDTYSSPLTNGLVCYHYIALALVGLLMFIVNMAIENDWVEEWIARWRTPPQEYKNETEMEDLEVATERYRVELAAMRAEAVARPTHLHTIGNINAGFVNTEGKGLKLDKTASLRSKSAGDILQCLSLRKEYSAVSGTRVAVHNLTLGIPPGECLALLGENGAGKSTTFGMLTGQLRPTAGDILLQECRVKKQLLSSGLISYCPQNDAIDQLVTVREQLRFYCRLRGISSEHEVINKTIEQFDLKKYTNQYTCTLSGGNKRKLCTAIAMMGRSPLILLDEPTSGMDPGARGVVSRGVRQACGAGRAVLLSTHTLDDARVLAHRLALLQRGRLRTVGPVHLSLERFGGGYVVGVRVTRGADAGRVWAAVRARMPHAVLQATHYTRLQFLLPRDRDTAGPTGVPDETLSRIFRELAALQSQYDIEDYTVNQSSLYQMFESFSDRKDEHINIPALSTNHIANNARRSSGDLTSVTSL